MESEQINPYFVILCPLNPRLRPEPKNPEKTSGGSATEDLLRLLYQKGLKEEHKKQYLERLHLVVGVNGPTDAKKEVFNEFEKEISFTKFNWKRIQITWNFLKKKKPKAKIKKEAKEGKQLDQQFEYKVPYSTIREALKNCNETKIIIEEIKTKDLKAQIFISIIDQKVVDFNYIYSSYLEIIYENLKDNKEIPAVMTTGYEFTRESGFNDVSRFDRIVRITTDKYLPGCVYYPEPNFCYHLPTNISITEEKFYESLTNDGLDRDNNSGLESVKLIRNILNNKKRTHKKLIFSDKNPIIINPTSRFKIKDNEQVKITQSHLNSYNWACGLLFHKILIPEKRKEEPSYHKKRGWLIELFSHFNKQSFLVNILKPFSDMSLIEQWPQIEIMNFNKSREKIIQAARESNINVIFYRKAITNEKQEDFIRNYGLLKYIEIIRTFWISPKNEEEIKDEWEKFWKLWTGKENLDLHPKKTFEDRKIDGESHKNSENLVQKKGFSEEIQKSNFIEDNPRIKLSAINFLSTIHDVSEIEEILQEEKGSEFLSDYYEFSRISSFSKIHDINEMFEEYKKVPEKVLHRYFDWKEDYDLHKDVREIIDKAISE